ncbi:MAG: hypothetical protein K0S11_952, partial [Gammaproteobacteria bacterium]|nr:hypothetical protein [Gammaproteobacteria bacterium]
MQALTHPKPKKNSMMYSTNSIQINNN